MLPEPLSIKNVPLFTRLVISNGMGAPSMYQLVLAAEGKLKSNVSITADTGSENDRLLSNGIRITAKEYFNTIIEPYAKDHKIHSYFVRARDKNGDELPPIIELLRKGITAGVPLFGSNGGRLLQSCTSKYKIAAIRQQLRRMRYNKAQIALGLTYNELHRMKDADVKWCENVFPLIDIGINDYAMRTRESFYSELDKRGIPYMLSSECDNCPHQDYTRWIRKTPETIDGLAIAEAKFDGLFFTDKRLPLKQAIRLMEKEYKEKLKQGELFDEGVPHDLCEPGYCYT